jgi:hypothetical protein
MLLLPPPCPPNAPPPPSAPLGDRRFRMDLSIVSMDENHGWGEMTDRRERPPGVTTAAALDALILLLLPLVPPRPLTAKWGRLASSCLANVDVGGGGSDGAEAGGGEETGAGEVGEDVVND